MAPRAFLKASMLFATALAAAAQVCAQAPAAKPVAGAPVPLQAFLGVLNTNQVAAKVFLGRIRDGWRIAYTAPLLELMAFVPVLSVQTEVLAQLERVTGQRSGGDLNPLYEWLWAREPGEHPDYAEFKAALYEQVDPRFREYFGKERESIIRLDEVRWGGVWRDGIPPLKNPKMIPARQASYLADDNIVLVRLVRGLPRDQVGEMSAAASASNPSDTAPRAPAAGERTLCAEPRLQRAIMDCIVHNCIWPAPASSTSTPPCKAPRACSGPRDSSKAHSTTCARQRD